MDYFITLIKTMSLITVKDVNLFCQNLTRSHLPDNQQVLVKKEGGNSYRIYLRNFDTGEFSNISPIGNKLQVYYYLVMFEKGLQFNQKKK